MAIPNPKPWTYEMYSLLPEDGKRHEIIDGEHCVTPAPSTQHQRIVHRLAVELELALREAGTTGEILAAPYDVVLSATDVVQPDLLFVAEDRRQIVSDKRIDGAPDLIVEVLSPKTRKRDEILKRDLYERFGLREYWIADPELSTVKIYRLAATEFGDPSVVDARADEELTTPLLPTLRIPLSRIFK